MRDGGVLVVGDVIDDVLVRPAGPIRADTDTPSRIDRVAGGSAANTAAWLGSLGVPTTLVATVGAEDLGRHAAALARHGVAALLAASARPTGTIVVVSTGERRTMLTDRGANEETGPEAVGTDLLDVHDTLHITGHAFTGADRDAGWAALLAAARRRGVRTCIAPGSAGLLAAFGADRFLRLAAAADVLVASGEEAAQLTGRADPAEAAEALGAGRRLAVVTLGRDGAVVVEADEVHRVAAVPADVVDVTGAGDAFAAGLLACLREGVPAPEAAARAAALAARAVGLVGARP